MHVLTIPKGIDRPIPVLYGREMLPGESYICTNAFVGAMMGCRYRVIIDKEMWALSALLTAVPFYGRSFNPDFDWNHKHIWLARGGGYGDLLMMTPLIRELQKRWPKCIIHVASGSQYHGIFYGLPVIEEMIPIPYQEHFEPNIIVAFEETVEGTPDAQRTHISQLFANKLGIDLQGDHRPSYTIKAEERAEAEAKFPRTNRKRIGIQYMASCLVRTYPLINVVVDMLLKKNIEVFLFGSPGQIKLKEDSDPNLINLTNLKLNFRQSAAVLATCDSAISPDSALVHLSSALDVPCVGLYGPFPASLRVSSVRTAALEGKGPCAPCFFHAATPVEFPAGMPCVKAGRCVILEKIGPGEIVTSAINLCSPIIDIRGT